MPNYGITLANTRICMLHMYVHACVVTDLPFMHAKMDVSAFSDTLYVPRVHNIIL